MPRAACSGSNHAAPSDRSSRPCDAWSIVTACGREHARVAVRHAGDEQAEPDARRGRRERGQRDHALEAVARTLAVHRLEVVEAPRAGEAARFAERVRATSVVPLDPLLRDIDSELHVRAPGPGCPTRIDFAPMARADDYLEYFRRVPMFSTCSKKDLKTVAANAERVAGSGRSDPLRAGSDRPRSVRDRRRQGPRLAQRPQGRDASVPAPRSVSSRCSTARRGTRRCSPTPTWSCSCSASASS